MFDQTSHGQPAASIPHSNQANISHLSARCHPRGLSRAVLIFVSNVPNRLRPFGGVVWRALELVPGGKREGPRDPTKEACIQAAICDTLTGVYSSFRSAAIAHKVSTQ